MSTLSALFGLQGQVLGRYVNGQSYPTLQTIQKFEAVLGWPASEQVQLIPPFWDWPLQSVSRDGNPLSEPTDLRYSMKLRQVLGEWAAANPRTVRSGAVRQHPSIPSRSGVPLVKRAEEEGNLPEFTARTRPLQKR